MNASPAEYQRPYRIVDAGITTAKYRKRIDVRGGDKYRAKHRPNRPSVQKRNADHRQNSAEKLPYQAEHRMAGSTKGTMNTRMVLHKKCHLRVSARTQQVNECRHHHRNTAQYTEQRQENVNATTRIAAMQRIDAFMPYGSRLQMGSRSAA